MRNETFSCEHCAHDVRVHPTGSARNHCHHCLYSKHVDENIPGDRLAICHGLMKPVGVDYRKGKGDMIIHICSRCQKKILNQVSPDDEFLRFVRELNKNL